MKKSNIKASNMNNKLKLPAKYKTKPYMAAAGAMALVVLMGGTAYASNDSKPGDILYSIDTTSEKVQSLLTFSPDSQADLALSLALERVEETQAVLEITDFNSTDLNTALNGLTTQRQALADLVIAQATLKQQAKQYEDAFDAREADLDAIFKDAKNSLKAQKTELKTQLKQAVATNNAEEIARVMAALTTVRVQLEALEAEKVAAEEALEVEEDRLEAELEKSEEALEAEEEANEDALEVEEESLEAEIERLDKEAEEAWERSVESSEREDAEIDHEQEQDEKDSEDIPEVESEHNEQESFENNTYNEEGRSSNNQGQR